ncbi:SAV_2336 N-terminal domain-related protein [Brasilonema sennae]|uniref:SAV_2336 N-terminal domain-related protein n=1 Tax=Brasilonema sennae TaxID=1397703 RepID=UPI001FEC635A|nr:SAV_2336 N-terminal domain-related protein [Brasilonema sennae]
MSNKFNQLIAALGKDLGLTGEEIADILWLTLQRQENGERKTHTTSQQSQQATASKPSNPTPANSNISEPPQIPSPTAAIYPETQSNKSQTSSESKALPLRIPDAPSLREPLTLAQALKPLMRRVDSGRKTVLDEKSTVERFAAEGICIPVLKSEPEPWLDVALVVDESKSMLIWRHTIWELKRLLEHYCVFRDVRTWGLVSDEDGEIYIRPGIGKAANQQRLASPRELIDPSSRRLVLVVSDCVAAIWRDGTVVNEAIKVWTNTQPVALIQMLPDSLWLRTGLGSGASVRLGSLTPGVANQNLFIKELLLWKDINNIEGEIKLPVLTLEPEVTLAWSQMVAGKSDAEASGFVFPSQVTSQVTSQKKVHPTKQPQTTQNQLSSQERVYRFRMTASPMARKLAGLLAAAPVMSLPVVRLIQETMLPKSRQVHVAEVFLGGLLKPLTPIETDTNPDTVQYDFMDDEIRGILLEDSPVRDSADVLDAVSKYVAGLLGKSLEEFVAVLKAPGERDDEQVKPFAVMAVKVLKQLGGDYKRFAEEIEKSSQVEIELRSAVGIDYTHLRNLLAAGKWKQADEETVRVILQAARQQKKGVLEVKDIDGFSCEDLKTVNQLWENYSKGRFGFGVQKQIYQSLGGTIEYDWQTWQDFGERIGWRRNSEWIDYTDFTFSVDAAIGHLPTWVNLFLLDVPGYRRGKIRSFLSRIETCHLSSFSPQIPTFEFDVITVNAQGLEIKREKRQATYYLENLEDNITLEMVAIPGGKFMMASPEGEGYESEKPQHEVTVQPFFIGKYPITQAQWRVVAALPQVNRELKPDPSGFKGDDFPVECVSWYDVVEFCARFSKKTGKDYRLPSEAEWEYACRARTTTPFHFGETLTDKLANYRANETFADEPKGEYREKTTSVGTFSPNAFGLYDMHGNVWEWCEDSWHENYQEAPTDGSAWHENENSKKQKADTDIGSRIGKIWKNIRGQKQEADFSDNDNRSLLRGGSWIIYPDYCRSAYRNYYNPAYDGNDIGFRVVCGGAAARTQ